MRTISDHILDILENSVRASADLIEIIISENKNNDLYTIGIRDNINTYIEEIQALK
jgi:hypothetical protein